MTKLKNIHPGEILSEEILIPLNITAYKLSKDIEILKYEHPKLSMEIRESLLIRL